MKERKEKKRKPMLSLSADLSIPPQNRRLASPFSSSSIFFNGVFQRVWEPILWILPLAKARFIPILKSKHQLNAHKHAGNDSHKKSKKQNAGRGRTAVHPSPRATRGALCLARSRHFSNDPFWATLDHGMCLGAACFGPVGLDLLLSSLGLITNHTFLP